MSKLHILYLSTRPLPLERAAELAAARDEGAGIVIVAPDGAPYRDPRFAHLIDHVIEAPIHQHDQTLTIIDDFIAAHGLDIRGVVAWTDLEVELAARVGAMRGLPASTRQAAQNVRNKANTRRLLDQLPGANPGYAIITDEDGLARALERVGVPCLLKPAGASGGRGIHELTTLQGAVDEFRAFVAYCNPGRSPIFEHFADDILVEERLQGTEHSVAGMVAGGAISIFAITDKRVDRALPLTYQTTTPSALPAPVQEQITDMARRAVALAGIDHCGFHVDIMVTRDGPRVLEIGGRLGGDCINSHLIPLSVPGLAPYRAIVRVALGHPVPNSNLQPRRRACMRLLLPPHPGRIERIHGMDAVRAHANVHEALQVRGPGDLVVLPRDQFDTFAIGCFIATCDLDQDIDAIADQIASLVHIEVTPLAARDAS